MRTLIVRSLIGLSLVLACAPGAPAVSYTATLLAIPSGSVVTSAVDGDNESQVGDIFGHAVLWSNQSNSVTDLHPTGFISTFAEAVADGRQVGWGIPSFGSGETNALLWSGTAASVVDLHPSGYAKSYAYGISGNSQVGFGSILQQSDQALLWNGTAASVINLNPANASQSHAYDIAGNQQVGNVTWLGANAPHAALWNGTPESIVDLNPLEFSQSTAFGTDGPRQVGNGIVATTQQTHALLWQGTAGSAVDLHPANFSSSYAMEVLGNTQVGYGQSPSGYNHALVWFGTAASCIDLDQYLPASPRRPFVIAIAEGLAPNGDIIGYATDSSGVGFAVKWSVIPEPSTWLLCVFALATPLLYRHKSIV